MDSTTLRAYDEAAASFADDWQAQTVPEDLYALVKRYFTPGLTADIGCGAGRDVAWLNANGYAAIGYDGSMGLLSEARIRHPQYRFEPALLPALEGVEKEQFQNVLCETVIMHLEPCAIPLAVARLLEILKIDGILYLSWRVTDNVSHRDNHQRLYAAFDESLVLAACAGQKILFNEKETSLSSGKMVQRVIVRKEK